MQNTVKFIYKMQNKNLSSSGCVAPTKQDCNKYCPTKQRTSLLEESWESQEGRFLVETSYTTFSFQGKFLFRLSWEKPRQGFSQSLE